MDQWDRGRRSEEGVEPRQRPVQARDRLPVRRVLLVMAGATAAALVGIAAAGWLTHARLAGAGALPEAVVLPVPERVGVVYQSAIPAPDAEVHRRAQRTRLEQYGWVDREQGVVRIPISRAIELRAAGESAP